MLDKLSKVSINHPWLVIMVFIIITAFFALQLPNLEIDTDMKSQIPGDMPSRVNLNKIEEIFGGTEIILINVTSDNILNNATLTRVKKLSDQFEKIQGIDKVNSLFTVPDISAKNNSLFIEDTITEIPETQKEIEDVKNKIINNDNVYGSIVAKDFSANAIVLVIEEGMKDNLVLDNINKTINNVPGEEIIYKSGLPVARFLMDEYIRKDMKKLLPLGILIMLVFLFFCFKQFRGMLLPFLVVIMSIIVTLGFIPLLGWKFQMVTIILPVILLAVANDYGIHIIARYQEENKPDNTKSEKEISYIVSKSLGKPIIAAGITTIIGILCLRAHILIPARQLGVLAGIGIGFALLGSILFIPAVLSLLPKAKPIKKKASTLEKLLSKTARMVTRHPVIILIISLVVVLLAGMGINRLIVDTNQISYFHNDEKLVKADNLARKYFGGSNIISLVAKGDILAPEVMKKLDNVVDNLEAHKKINTVTSISTQISEMNQVLHNDNPEFNKIPESRNAIEQYFMLYSMSADTEKIIDFNHEYALVNARIETNSTAEISQIIDKIKKDLDGMNKSPISVIGGVADIASELAELVIKGQVYSLLISLLIVVVILMLLFKSPTAGFLSAVPLIFSTVSLFGLMGYLNIELNIVTALLSSIMIGVGIDYTIHFLWRYREEKQVVESRQAVINTLMTTGKGIVFNAFSVIIGFVVLLFSKFLPVSFFGFLVVISISTCLIGALLILPAICIITRPFFLEGVIKG